MTDHRTHAAEGTIDDIVLERRVSRADATLRSAWVRAPNALARPESRGAWLTSAPPAARPTEGAPALVMIASESDLHSAWLQPLVANRRSYWLVGPELASTDLGFCDALIRRVASVPATALHIGSSAHVWIGGGRSLTLDEEQSEALRLTFLQLFWRDATEEAWAEGQKLEWRAVRERPFELSPLPNAAKVRLERADAKLEYEMRGACVYSNSASPPAVAAQRLWFAASARHHKALAELSRKGTEVLWDELDLPDIAVGSEGGEMLLRGSKARLRVQLTSAQAEETRQILEGDASWRFRLDVRIGDERHRSSSFWLADEASARRLDDEQEIAVSSVQATALRDAHRCEPSSLPEAQPLALAARYRWTVVPPRVPRGSDEDALVKRWRALDQQWSERLRALRDSLTSRENERSRIGKLFDRLASAVIGFTNTHVELAKRANALEALRPSEAGPAEASTLFDELDAVEAKVVDLQGAIVRAERDERTRQEEERQRAEWEQSVARAKDAAQRAKHAIAEAEKTRAELDNEAHEVELASKQCSADEQRDLDARRKRNADERKRGDELLSRLRDELRQHESAAGRAFEFVRPSFEPRPADAKGRRFIPTTHARSKLDIPNEALAEVGALRVCKQQRYLVIDRWEHLSRGESAAARLAAKLVATEAP